jgi:hypothetical protein
MILVTVPKLQYKFTLLRKLKLNEYEAMYFLIRLSIPHTHL